MTTVTTPTASRSLCSCGNDAPIPKDPAEPIDPWDKNVTSFAKRHLITHRYKSED